MEEKGKKRMKNIKKFLCLLLTMVMITVMAVPAFAEGVDNTTPTPIPQPTGVEGDFGGGSITIEDAVPGQTYKVYQILYLESYNPTTGAYLYKANSAWETWLKTQNKYVRIDGNGYVTWVNGDVDSAVAEFAKLAQAEVTKSSISSAGSVTATAAGEEQIYSTVSFNNLKLGYYLVDTTLGTLCSLDTTNPSVKMQEKNEVPTNVKEVQEDSTSNYGVTNDANIGQTINFQSTITAQAGAENYVFHDKMDEGLTFGGNVTVTLGNETVGNENYTFKVYTAEDETKQPSDGCTFEIVFSESFCNGLEAGKKIVISYSATLNENAVLGDEGNKNESKLSCGEDGKFTTTPSTTRTRTWEVDIFKYTESANNSATPTPPENTEISATPTPIPTPLPGATFTLSKATNGINPIALVSGENNIYRVATSDDTNTITEITTDSSGRFTIKGLDSDTYYLTETKAPDDYNKLSVPITIVIDKNGSTNIIGKNNNLVVVNEVKVLNQTGTELPSTGGMGTTIFYVVGGILVAVAAVLLIAKRRMKGEE